jgi:hypothetical protein
MKKYRAAYLADGAANGAAVVDEFIDVETY